MVERVSLDFIDFVKEIRLESSTAIFILRQEVQVSNQ